MLNVLSASPSERLTRNSTSSGAAKNSTKNAPSGASSRHSGPFAAPPAVMRNPRWCSYRSLRGARRATKQPRAERDALDCFASLAMTGGSTARVIIATARSQLDVAIEPLDPCGPVLVDLRPVLILQLGEVVLRLRHLFDDLALERDLAVGRDHPVRRALHVFLHLGREMRVDVLHREVRLLRVFDEMQAGAPSGNASVKRREIDVDAFLFERLHEVEIIRRNVDLLLLEQRRVGAEVRRDRAYV